MEAIRISCAGYPTRKTFSEFISRFGILSPNVLEGSNEVVTTCKRLLEKTNLQGYQVGKTKVFLRAGQMAELDARRSEVLGKSACIIQRKIRSYICRKSFILLQRSSITLQTVCRGQLARHQYECLRREAASLKIQKHGRRYLARKSYNKLCSSTISIQTGMRGMAARIELLRRRQIRAAIVIQSQCRKFLTRLHYMRLKKAAIITQCVWRGKLARRELRKLKMAAKETGALQAAKSMLEKQVEELTWRLQLEKRMRCSVQADIEEAKTQETAKLHSALQDIQLEFQETKAQLIKEREAAKKASEHVQGTQEVPVVDHELVNKVTAENEMLKAMVSSLEKQIDETERKYKESNKLSEERLKQALDAETKMIELKTTMQRLEEKLSDMEAEAQVLRHQALLSSSTRKSSGRFDAASQEPQSPSPSKWFGTDADAKWRRSQIERLNESVEVLINSMEQNVGFSHGKPVAAFTIYRCLMHWRSFEAEKTNVFDRLIQMVGSAMESADNNDLMAYWLSNTSFLLFLLQKTIKGSGAGPTSSPPKSFFGRMAQSFRSSPSAANLKVGKDVFLIEAKYPALLFKQQLTAYVETIYGIVRDNLRRELSPLLSLCIQAPRASKGTTSKSSDHWCHIVEILDALLCTLKKNFVPPILVQKMFAQIFSHINVQLFNSLLLRRENCTFSNGEYVKAGLAELELWCGRVEEEYVGSSWDELKPTRQAVGFLVTHQKYKITYDEITNDLCPVLSIQQLYRVCTLYYDDNYNTQSVSSDVISSMKILASDDSKDDDSNSFLMDDDSSIPFSFHEICGTIQENDFSDVQPAADLLEHPDFQFLQE